MKALIVAGGLGTRLKPITNLLPKPLVPIEGKPALFWQIERLAEAGATEIEVSTHYMSDYITAMLSIGILPPNVRVNTCRESEPCGTFGCVGTFARNTFEPFLVVNADVFSDSNFREFYDESLARNTLLSVAITDHTMNCPYGTVALTVDGMIDSVVEKPSMHYSVLAGVYVVRPEISRFITPRQPTGVNDVMDRLLASGERISAYRFRGKWIDIGTPEQLESASALGLFRKA
jgi:NDP-sugar pyrophosphorylase family protein